MKLDWNNPGRIDPKLYIEKNSVKENLDQPESDDSGKMDTGLLSTGEILEEDVSEKFDLFDEFNSDMEKNSTEVLRLTHTKTLVTQTRRWLAWTRF